ncbi:RecX family transcriptional regulator [Patescibacteria group bacterium]|nr:RecX family transcriptional regulator [Patescibacteria group bacterium]MBU1931338.1 RecX family transcriptional regulator [Patescibacteria group bacterium]
MPQITKLKAQKNAKRANLYVDNQFIVGLSLDLVVKRGLAVGQSLSNKQLDKLLTRTLLEKLYNQALNFLSFRPRSPQEVKRFLIKKTQAGPEFKKVIDLVLTKLDQRGLVDQSAFAQWWLEQRLRFRPKGKLALKQELRQKGIEPQIIDQVLAEVDEVQTIRDFYVQKLAKKSSLISQPKKLIAYLQRRGFSWSAIKTCVDEWGKKE